MTKWSSSKLKMVEEEEDSLFDQRELLIHNKQTHEKFKWKQKVLKTVALSMAFFCLGLCIAIPGPTLLELGRRVHRDTEHMTFIFTARSVGFLIGSLVGGVLFDFFDQQILLFYTLSIVAVATAGVPWCTALLTVSALICTQGVAIGVLDTGGNVFCIKIWGKRSAPFMQVLHFVFGVGAFLAPLIAGPFLLDAGLLHNATMGSYHPIQLKSFALGADRFVRDISAANYVNKGHNFDKFRSNYNEKILNYGTTQHALGLEVSGLNAILDKDNFSKNTGSFNKKHDSSFVYGRVSDLMNFRTKRDISDNQTVIGQKTKLENEALVVINSTEANKKQNLVPSQPAENPKKPDVIGIAGLSNKHADSGLAIPIIIDLIKNAPKSNPDTEKLTATKVMVKSDGQIVTSGVEVNGSYGWNGTDDVSLAWTSSVLSTAAAAQHEPESSSVLSTAAAAQHEPESSSVATTAEISDSVFAAAIAAVSVNASAADTSTVTPTASSGTPTLASISDSPTVASTSDSPTVASTSDSPTVASTSDITTPRITSTMTSLKTTISTLPTTTTTTTTTTIPTITITTTAAPTSSTTAVSVAANSTKASGNVTTSITTSKSTAIKPETTGDIFADVMTTLTGLSKIQVAYTVIGILLAITSGFFLFLHCKDRSLKSPVLTRQNRDVTRNPFSTCFIASVILLLFFFFLAYMGMEATFGGLLMTFAVEYPGGPLTPSQGATLTALFWGCLAFGRGCSICIARYVKAAKMMLMNLALMMFGALILSFSIPVNPATLWVGTVMLGLGMSSLFPTAISWADSCYPLSGRATAVFVAGSGVGEMTLPILTGYLYEMKNNMYFMYMMLFLSSVLATLYIVVQVVVYQKVKSGQRKSISGFMRLKNIEDEDEDDDLGIAEGINLGITETIWRRRLQGEEQRGQEHGDGSKFAESTKLIM